MPAAERPGAAPEARLSPAATGPGPGIVRPTRAFLRGSSREGTGAMVGTGAESARKAAKGGDAIAFPGTTGTRRCPPGPTAGPSGAVVLALLNAAGVGLWVALNAGLIPGVQAFDPYPFHLLALVASLEAVVLSLAVLVRLSRLGPVGLCGPLLCGRQRRERRATARTVPGPNLL
jgi:hypothetical protein